MKTCIRICATKRLESGESSPTWGIPRPFTVSTVKFWRTLFVHLLTYFKSTLRVLDRRLKTKDFEVDGSKHSSNLIYF
jgi:hypothetical protein